MRESQYTDSYLATNGARGLGNGLTIGSFLAYELRGRARQYAGRYADALRNSLARRAGVVEGQSARGGTAYYPTQRHEVHWDSANVVVNVKTGAEVARGLNVLEAIELSAQLNAL